MSSSFPVQEGCSTNRKWGADTFGTLLWTPRDLGPTLENKEAGEQLGTEELLYEQAQTQVHLLLEETPPSHLSFLLKS